MRATKSCKGRTGGERAMKDLSERFSLFPADATYSVHWKYVHFNTSDKERCSFQLLMFSSGCA